LELTYKKQDCIHGTIGKGRQAKLNKVSNHIVSRKSLERMFLNVAAVMSNKDLNALVESFYKDTGEF
jgi:hypothetical protein